MLMKIIEGYYNDDNYKVKTKEVDSYVDDLMMVLTLLNIGVIKEKTVKQ